METETKLAAASVARGRGLLRLGRALGSVIALFKLRVVILLQCAALGGAFLGARGWPGAGPILVLFVAGTLAAGGASAINEYLERESDARMTRTRRRPLVTHAMRPGRWVLFLGAAMILAPAVVLLPSNLALAAFLVLGAAIYIMVYTLWLKPRTPLNIVIGGAAGSCTVLCGGAAVGAWSDPAVLGLAVLIFLWTPIHFWSLALVYRDDYRAAEIPMLPARTTPRWAAFWSLVHGVAAVAVGLGLGLGPTLGVVYLAPVAGASLYLLVSGGRLLAVPSQANAWRVFHASNFYLALVVLALCLDAALKLGRG